MSKNKLCYPRHGKDGTIISYRLYCNGKDPYTGKNKQFTKTWKVPKGLSKKEIELQLKITEVEFKKECEKKLNGNDMKECNLTFGEYSKQWLERLINVNEESYSYYVQAENALKVINPYLGNCLLKSISPIKIQNFLDYICNRTYTKETVTVKKSIEELIIKNNFNKTEIATECGINRLTLRLSTKIGTHVSIETARTISRYFNVPLAQYFDVEKNEIKYSKATNSGIRRILVIILGEAKRQRLIEHNYASREYTKPIKGIVKEKEIFDEQETKEFVKAVLNEENIKKKTVFSLLIFLGLRKAEICGLRWEDIDFYNQTLRVSHNALYFKKFGMVIKSPKTETSKRSIRLPEQLVKILGEYKNWYDNQKVNYGDLWANTNYLFLQENGNIMNPSTINNWLKKFNLKNGFKHITPHSLRHTCITMQINAGIPLKVVSTRAGHANEKITLEIYTHTLQTQDDKAAKTYNEYLLSL